MLFPEKLVSLPCAQNEIKMSLMEYVDISNSTFTIIFSCIAYLVIAKNSTKETVVYLYLHPISKSQHLLKIFSACCIIDLH